MTKLEPCPGVRQDDLEKSDDEMELEDDQVRSSQMTKDGTDSGIDASQTQGGPIEAIGIRAQKSRRSFASVRDDVQKNYGKIYCGSLSDSGRSISLRQSQDG